MAKSFGAGDVFFANAVRVNKRLIVVHADGEWTQKLCYRLTFRFGEELSSCGRVIGYKSAWYA